VDFPTPTYLRSHELVLAAFGYWPTFHDSPVLSFRGPGEDSTLDFTLHAFEASGESDARGYHILQKHHLVRFAFGGVVESDLEHFLRENILFDLGFSAPSEFQSTGRFTVWLDSAMGGDLCGSFVAQSGEVVSVLPCDKDSQPI
jgi:hypothetical protein